MDLSISTRYFSINIKVIFCTIVLYEIVIFEIRNPSDGKKRQDCWTTTLLGATSTGRVHLENATGRSCTLNTSYEDFYKYQKKISILSTAS